MRLTSSVHSPRRKAERLIAGGRVLLALATQLAISLDPAPAGGLTGSSHTALLLYILYSLVLMLLNWEARAGLLRLALITQLLDLVAFTYLLALTGGTGSPLFVLFLFSIFTAALRWQQQGTLLTTLAVLGLYGGQAWLEQSLGNGRVDLDSLIIRCVYLVVAALALGYLTAYERHTRIELSRLVRWSDSQGQHGDLDVLLREALPQVLSVLEMSRALLIWDEPDEPFRMLAYLGDGAFSCTRLSPEEFEPLLSPVLTETDFLCLADGHIAITVLTPGGSHRWHGYPWHADLQARYSLANSLCLRLQTEQIQGRLFISGKPDLCTDDLYLGELIARQLGSSLERYYAQQRFRQLAQAQERIRIARDLHDGLLQSLTGMALQLESLRRQSDTGGEMLCQRIVQLQSQIADEQQGLRLLIRQLKPNAVNPENRTGLVEELSRLASRTEQQWGIRVQLLVEPGVDALAEPLACELRFLLLEAFANSGKHAQASRVHAHVARIDEWLCLRVRDDGQGFAFVGRHDLATLVAMQAGPRSLMERTLVLGGELSIESSRRGSLLEIKLPWPSINSRTLSAPDSSRIAS